VSRPAAAQRAWRAVSSAPLGRRVVYRVLAVVVGRPRRLDLVVCRLCGAIVVAHGIEQHAQVHVATGPNGHGHVWQRASRRFIRPLWCSPGVEPSPHEDATFWWQLAGESAGSHSP
jgi:hypothetical protein